MDYIGGRPAQKGGDIPLTLGLKSYHIKKLDTMFFLREGSHTTSTPYFITLPENTNKHDIKQNQFMFFPERDVAQWFYESGFAEKSLIHWVLDTFISPDSNFIDIGAHVGTYSWTCGKKAKHTYAFECGPKTFCYLAANIALHQLEDKVSPFPNALGNEEKTIDYYIRSEDGGGNGVKELSHEDSKHKKVKIFMKTLDSFHFENVGFIKIDVEGFEKEVLMGGLDTLRRNNFPKILFESWGSWKEKEGVPADAIRNDLFRFLEGIGYTIISVSGAQDMYLATKT